MATNKTSLPRLLYDAAGVRELDRVAIEKLAIPGFELMRRAGLAAFHCLLEKWPQTRHLLVFAGAGNNGGDAYMVAALAKKHGLDAALILLGDHEKLTGEALQARQHAIDLNLSMSAYSALDAGQLQSHCRPYTVVVDGILGSGINRKPDGDYAAAIDAINVLDLPVLALDIPSGLSSDTGAVFGSSVIADLTNTFIGVKQGLLTARGVDLAGEIIFSDLTLPEAIYSSDSSPTPTSLRVDINDIHPFFCPRAPSSHKGSFGHVLVVGGDKGYGGAAILAAEAAAISGSGLVSLITRYEHVIPVLARTPELMVSGFDEEQALSEDLVKKAQVIVLGPGLGKSTWSRKLFQLILHLSRHNDIPLVLDADGLNLLSELNSETTGLKRDNWILTPHPGEAARLLACSTRKIQQDRFAAVKQLQTQWGGVCLLKGAGSLICYGKSRSGSANLKNPHSARSDAKAAIPEQNRQLIELCTEGNAGMATAGMGDVLSGITAAFIAQGMALHEALRCAVCVHGESADLAAADHGQRGLQATDLFGYVRQLINPGQAIR